MRQIFLDTETTGLSPETGDRVVEIGCVEMVNRRLTGRNLHVYLNPERPNSEEAVRVHGLTDEFLADKPVFATVAAEFVAYLQGAEVVIHNAAFDVGFLDAELRRVKQPGVATLAQGIVDTLAMAREAYPGKANSLDALCRRLEVDNSKRTLHGALLDAELLAEVYIRLTRGQHSLVIDGPQEGSEGADSGRADAQIDLSQFTLTVLTADADELAAHETVLTELDKASGGKTIFRQGLAQPA
ncbi:MAG TPA: DNA polymerase III subunit epsilon [Burkholderiaceae bacterium]|nr:DNA polymerase III subunit epsilon [Burkholderiaceae bacterium]HMX09440.1 DNA polymerase III subunit epsilon [Burkholderiaceae bacterium]HMY99069.1 DNA polymerase III subunit epsilon [Burkholderiaceae bacterium]HNB43380.1 DNA polymerase III subunit epsilon [Burkholderiaceae bacterium]HNG77929.1 DNA polymerase III subunit epsilon [Burkholderiaceae bacterium]